MPAPPRNLRQTSIFWNSSACEEKFAAWLETLQDAQGLTICISLSKFRTFINSSQNYAGREQK